MKPEDKAREEIDRQLEQCGWIVQDHSQMNISAGPGASACNDSNRRDKKKPQAVGYTNCGGRPKAVPANVSSYCVKVQAEISYTVLILPP